MHPQGRLRWGIIGSGSIAHTFAASLPTSRTGHLVAVGSRSQGTADAFCRDFPGTRAHGSYEALLGDPNVQAVYISTPHPMHLEWTVRAAQAGKHILCEKPIALNQAEAVARHNGVFLMEAFMYRCHPQTALAVQLVRSGRLGRVRQIEATFAFECAFNPESRLFRNDLGGGAILDVGCYCMSMTRLLAGAVEGKPFAEPIQLKGLGVLGRTGVDKQAQSLLGFAGGLQARLFTALRVNLGASVAVTGSDAILRIPSPWLCGHPVSTLEVIAKGEVEKIEITTDRPLYSLEIDTVAHYLSAGEAPAMPIDDTLGNMAALDRWRNEVGMVYESEKKKG